MWRRFLRLYKINTNTILISEKNVFARYGFSLSTFFSVEMNGVRFFGRAEHGDAVLTFGLDGERVNFADHSLGEPRTERSALARVRAAFHVDGERRADHGHAVVEDVDGVRAWNIRRTIVVH